MKAGTRRPELLAPAGNFEKLRTAFHFGADAVYLGGNSFSLRAFSDNFELSEIREAVTFARAVNKKIYAAVNAYQRTEKFGALNDYIEALNGFGIDAVIVSDMGVLALLRRSFKDIKIHLSTQANTLNAEAVRFYRDLGVARIILARELSIDEIARIRDEVRDIELECFVHGAMCVAYSGRCILSNYMTGRDANSGKCAQACRWRYGIREISRGDELTVEEDEHGTYLLNSKDLRMIEHLDKLIKVGVDSFKIEGRMKSEYYVGSVVNAYKRALDAVLDGGFAELTALSSELEKTANRGYTTGFYLGEGDTINRESSKMRGDAVFAAKVLGYDEQKAAILVEQRNAFKKGDVLEAVSDGPDFLKQIKADVMYNTDGEPVEQAKRVQEKIYIASEIKLNPYDMLRLCRKDTDGR